MALKDAISSLNAVPTTTPNNDAYWDWETNENTTWDGTTNGKSPEENNPDYNGGKKSSDISNDPKADFANWNGDVLGYFTYMSKTYGGAYTDYLNNWILSEGSAQNAREYNASREDSAYQRMFEDWKKAGINPYLILQSGASPVQSSSSTGYHYSGSYLTTEELKKEQNEQKWAQLFLSVFSTVIMCAMLM